jgi:hypothetical protein
VAVEYLSIHSFSSSFFFFSFLYVMYIHSKRRETQP